MGVDAIWINPFFESPFCDAGYDISDYCKVAPRYGTNEDAKKLFEEAHKRGLRILFDFVASYTSIEHPWFKASARQDTNKYTNWYVWNDNTWMNPPKEYQDAFIKGYSERNGQFMRNFYYCQPALNYGFALPDTACSWQLPTNHLMCWRCVRNETSCSVLARYGADGFRAIWLSFQNCKCGVTTTLYAHEDATKILARNICNVADYPNAFMISEWSYPVDALDNCFHADFYHWFDGYNDLFQKKVGEFLMVIPKVIAILMLKVRVILKIFSINLAQYTPTNIKVL